MFEERESTLEPIQCWELPAPKVVSDLVKCVCSSHPVALGNDHTLDQIEGGGGGGGRGEGRGEGSPTPSKLFYSLLQK